MSNLFCIFIQLCELFVVVSCIGTDFKGYLKILLSTLVHKQFFTLSLGLLVYLTDDRTHSYNCV